MSSTRCSTSELRVTQPEVRALADRIADCEMTLLAPARDARASDMRE